MTPAEFLTWMRAETIDYAEGGGRHTHRWPRRWERVAYWVLMHCPRPLLHPFMHYVYDGPRWCHRCWLRAYRGE